MAGISTTTSGVNLPSAQELFASSAPTTADPALMPGTTGTTGTAGTNGTTGTAGAASTGVTAEPAGTSAAYDPSLDQLHPKYPNLLTSHVLVLEAVGTPEMVIAQLSTQQIDATYLDQYIQNEILQNPEGWDQFVGNPEGTARAGLQQAFPGMQLPAAWSNSPVVVPRVDSQVVPIGGATDSASEAEGLLKGVVLAAAAVGVGALAWKFFKGRGAGEVKAVATDSLQALIDQLPSESANMYKALLGKGVKPDDLLATHRILQQSVLAGGGMLASSAHGHHAVHAAATADAVINGHGVANGFLMSVGAAAEKLGMPMEQALSGALADRMADVSMQLARNGGTFADLAAVKAASGQVAAAGGKASLQQSLAGLIDLLV